MSKKQLTARLQDLTSTQLKDFRGLLASLNLKEAKQMYQELKQNGVSYGVLNYEGYQVVRTLLLEGHSSSARKIANYFKAESWPVWLNEYKN